VAGGINYNDYCVLRQNKETSITLQFISDSAQLTDCQMDDSELLPFVDRNNSKASVAAPAQYRSQVRKSSSQVNSKKVDDLF